MTNEPDLQSYTAADQGAVEDFFERSWQNGRFPFDPAGKHSDLRRIPAEYQIADGDFWTLRLDQQVVGTVAVRRLPENTAEVKRLNVLLEHRGKGYGDRLLRHALSHARAKSFRAVRLDTLRNPSAAVHLFEKYGFTEIPRYNSNPDADLFMELELQSPRSTQIV